MDSIGFEQVRVIVLPDGRVDRANAAKFLGRAPKTLAEWKRLGIGPDCQKTGGRIFYNIDALRAFAQAGAH